MLDFSKVFNVIIRLVFIVAFGAFLLASLRHVAVFFHGFEPDPTGQDWAGSYALAWSIDGTALILTIGMMFFGKSMPWYAKTIVWLFIVGLTGFSWIVNWEYAKAFQSTELTSHLDPIWQSINPILASSFAFLNLAYSIVSEFFGAKPKTVEELQAELADLTGTKAELVRQIREVKGPSVIQRLKETAKEVRSATQEVLTAGNTQAQSEEVAVTSPVNTQALSQMTEEITPEVRIAMPESATDPDTGEREAIAKSVNNGVPANVTNFPRGDASKRIVRLLAKHPEMTPAELAKRAKVSRPYASRVRSQMLSQQSM